MAADKDPRTINFTDRNAVEKFLETKKFRHCANLECSRVDLHRQVLYMPMCLDDRFNKQGDAEFFDMPSAQKRTVSPVTYMSIPNWAPFISCPHDCKGYRNRTIAKAQKTVGQAARWFFGEAAVKDSRTNDKRWWERPFGIVVLGVVVTVVGGLIVWLIIRHYDKPTLSTAIERPTQQTQSSVEQSPKQPPSGPIENQKASDSIAVEVRRPKTPVEFFFQASGEKKQRITSSVFPTLIEVEPAPTGVQDADLPKDVAVNGGTITVLRFGQGYILFDTYGVPIGTPIRGRILGYIEQPRRSVPPAVSATKPTSPPVPAPALPLPMSQECAPGANCAQSSGQTGGITAGQINMTVVRSLTAEEKVRLTDVLKKATGTVTVCAVESGQALGEDIYDAFKNAGWNMQEPEVQNTIGFAHPMDVDIAVFVHNRGGKWAVSDPAIVNAIHSIAALGRFKSEAGVSDQIEEGVLKISIGPPQPAR